MEKNSKADGGGTRSPDQENQKAGEVAIQKMEAMWFYRLPLNRRSPET